MTRSDVKAWHSSGGSPTRLIGYWRYSAKCFPGREGMGIVNKNPVVGVQMFREKKRERFATDADLARIGEWLMNPEKARKVHPSFPLAVKLLALTGMRLAELTLEWSMVESRTAPSSSPTPRVAPEQWRLALRPVLFWRLYEHADATW